MMLRQRDPYTLANAMTFEYDLWGDNDPEAWWSATVQTDPSSVATSFTLFIRECATTGIHPPFSVPVKITLVTTIHFEVVMVEVKARTWRGKQRRCRK